MLVRKIYGFKKILSKFGFKQQQPTPLWCDNESAIKLSKDLVQHKCSKHIELHMHFIRNIFHGRILEVLFFPTDDQVTDIFTKSLRKLRSMLGFQVLVIKTG